MSTPSTGLRSKSGSGRDPEEPSEGIVASFGRLLDQPLAPYYILLGSAAMLLLLGLTMVLSASGLYSMRVYENSYAIFGRQLLWAVVAIPVALIISRQPPHRFKKVALLVFVGSIGLLLLTFVPGFGAVVNGSRNWLDFGGPMRLQPSEFAKFALILWGAHVYAKKGERITDWRQLIAPFLIGAVAVVGLTIGQRDLGTAAIISAIVLALLWTLGVPGRLVVLVTVPSVMIGVAFVMIEPYRRARFTAFLDPFADPLNTGYQAVNSIYAFASGGWWGSGLGASRQKWGRLPEAHTDFIYAVIGEELGFVGAVLVLFLVFGIAYAGIRIAREATDTFTRLLAAGITAWLLTQYAVNIGGALGVLPITGVPLPLVSYGGSALIITLAAVAVLLAVARSEPAAAEAIRARAAKRRIGRRRRPWERRKG